MTIFANGNKGLESTGHASSTDKEHANANAQAAIPDLLVRVLMA